MSHLPTMSPWLTIKAILVRRLVVLAAVLFLGQVMVLVMSNCVSAQSHDYRPLALGWEWHYAAPNGQTQHWINTGDQIVRGRLTRVTHRVIVGGQYPQTIDNYFSANAEGDFFLHGGRNFTFPLVIAYEPPLMLVDAPLGLGKRWTTAFSFCEGLGEDVPCTGPYDYPQIVAFEGDVTVPAGTFYSYGIAFDDSPPTVIGVNDQRFDLFGRYLGEGAEFASDGAIGDWYSEGLGQPQFDDAQLVEWSSPLPTSSEPSSWGQVKGLFR